MAPLRGTICCGIISPALTQFNAYQSDFDKGKDCDSAYIYGPAMPRSWFVGVKLEF